MTEDDKRKNNGRPSGTSRWTDESGNKERKRCFSLSLTPTARNWLKQKGGCDYIERLARTELGFPKKFLVVKGFEI